MAQPTTSTFASSYPRHIKAEVKEDEAGRPVVSLADHPATQNFRGDVHGGAISGLIDIAIIRAVRDAYPPETECSTVSLTVNYLRPARGELSTSVEIANHGKTLAFCEARIFNRDAELVALGTGVVRLFPQPSRNSTHGQ